MEEMQRNKNGQPFSLAIRLLQIVPATLLLKLTTLSVGGIGNAVGYPNPLHFSRAFKSVYGISLRAWRMQQTRK